MRRLYISTNQPPRDYQQYQPGTVAGLARMTTIIATPSGPDGDFIEKDIQQMRKGKAVTSLRLIPDGGVLRVFHGEDEDVFARFQKSTSGNGIVFSCLHNIGLASALSNGKQQKICCSTKITINCDPLNKGQGGGANISTLRAHCNVHFSKATRSKPPLKLLGQRNLQSFFTKRAFAETDEVATANTNRATVASYSAQTSTMSDISVDQKLEKDISCCGVAFYEIVAVPDHFDFLLHYPTRLHQMNLPKGVKQPSWFFDSRGNFFSNKCEKIVNDGKVNRRCSPCSELNFNPYLKNIMNSSIESSLSISASRQKDIYSSAHDLINKRNAAVQLSNKSKLLGVNTNRHIACLSCKINSYTRLTEAVQTNNIPRLRTLMANHFKSGRSVSSFVEKLERASTITVQGVTGNYRSGLLGRTSRDSNGTFDAEYVASAQLSFLAWKLGCGQLLKTVQISVGALSKTTIRRRIKEGALPASRIRITHSINDLGKQAIYNNVVDALFSAKCRKWLPQTRVSAVLMFDGIALEPRLGLDNSQLPHQVGGLCRHCNSATFSTYQDFLDLRACIKAEEGSPSKIHEAVEAEVVAIGFIGDKDHTHIIPLAVSPTCKKDQILRESTNSIQWILDAVIEAYNDNDGPTKIGPIVTLASDGASHFRLASATLMSDRLPQEIVQVYTGCKLFNVSGSRYGCTTSCDWDHLGKRSRERLKSLIGITLGTLTVTKNSLAIYGCYAGIFSTPEEAELILNPADAMDVYEMTLCLQAVAMFARIPFTSYPIHFQSDIANAAIFREPRLLGNVFHYMAILIIGHDGVYKSKDQGNHYSITELLVAGSTLSHLLFYLFRRNKSKFLPSQNYRNWQDTIKSMYVSVTMHKTNNIANYWWFLDSTKRLEQFFGILRSMRGGDLNFTLIGLRDRMVDATTIGHIYAENPHWNTLSRKLSSSFDRKNVRSWKGNTDVQVVNEGKCWNDGRDKAVIILRASQLFTADDLSHENLEHHVDILHPLGRRVGVDAGEFFDDDEVIDENV